MRYTVNSVVMTVFCIFLQHHDIKTFETERTCRFPLSLLISKAPTLNRAAALLGQSQVLLTQQIDRLVLVNLHAGAHVAVSMYEEREGAGQVLTAEKEQMEDYSRVWSYSLRESSTLPGGLWEWCVDS